MEKAVLANANLRGDNCHRGAAWGTLLDTGKLVKGESKWGGDCIMRRRLVRRLESLLLSMAKKTNGI